jgi:transposase InsO family protein
VKFLQPLPGTKTKVYQDIAIDDCTRIRVLKISEKHNQKTAIQFIDYVLEKLPFQVEVIQTDSGSEFQAAFHWHVLDKGIQYVYIRPATRRLNGKVERSHRIDGEEFYRLLEDDIDFLTVAIAVVAQARWGDRPAQLAGDLADSEVLQERARNGVLPPDAINGHAGEAGTESAVDHEYFLHLQRPLGHRVRPGGDSLDEEYFL